MTAEQLKRARKALDLEQTQLARKLGVHPMTVSKWERGISPIPKATGELVRLWAAAKRTASRRNS
jgi:transcriptional regulator with XRE-family HTH domain